MIKLNLGSGSKPIPGFINIDILAHPGVDLKADVSDLPLQENYADLIYACHVLEHFGRHQILDVLRGWCRVLKPGGTLRIAVPDFESVVDKYSYSYKLPELVGLVCGGQRDQYDYHKMIFDFFTLEDLLKQAGFTDIKRYDWRKTEHAQHDDYSQAYLPHLDKEHGKQMSLNVEGIKA